VQVTLLRRTLASSP